MNKILLGLIFITSALFAGEDYFVVTESQHQTVHKFNMSKDGYVLVKKLPIGCGDVYLLDSKNKVLKGIPTQMTTLNEKLQRGNYKLQVIAEYNDCNINVIY